MVIERGGGATWTGTWASRNRAGTSRDRRDGPSFLIRRKMAAAQGDGAEPLLALAAPTGSAALSMWNVHATGRGSARAAAPSTPAVAT
eukprot:7107619-Prymnesium_polylepis.1